MNSKAEDGCKAFFIAMDALLIPDKENCSSFKIELID
jgi:hypothetical protein